MQAQTREPTSGLPGRAVPGTGSATLSPGSASNKTIDNEIKAVPAQCTHQTIGTATLNGSLQIATPKTGDVIPGAKQITRQGTEIIQAAPQVRGSYKNVAPDLKIWSLTYSPATNRFYPQMGIDVRDPAQGQFQTETALVGQSGDSLEIVVVITDGNTSQFLASKKIEEENDAEAGHRGLTVKDLANDGLRLSEKACVTVGIVHG
ncbi:MAG: hypothetical protein ACRDYA_05780 [Egibacteraceae bacterium]